MASALAAGECDSIRAALRKHKILDKVKDVLHCLDFALRGVEGSESERELFRQKFQAMRIWNGCSFVFFTLNPHDTKTPLLVAFVSEHRTQIERVSLDWNDEEMAAYYERVKQGNPLRMHELAARWPDVAARCVHWAFDHTIQNLFRCSLAANWKPKRQHIDGIPALSGMPGLIGHPTGYLSIVEPQMRMTEHMHSLWQVLGYDHLRDFFASGKLIDRFRELFSFAASIAFESPEAFGDRCGTGHGMQALRESHVMPVRKGQLD